VVSGSGWSAAAPTATAPNTIAITPPGTNGAGATFALTAAYADATCSQSGTVCSTTFTMTNDLQTLFVANQGYRTVTAYLPPYTGTPTTISSGSTTPYEIALDSANDLFVANDNGGSPPVLTLSKYAPPYTGVATAVGSSQIGSVMGLVLAANGDLFLADLGGNTVTEYASPYTGSAIETLTPGAPYALALDSAENLYVAEFSGVSVYAPPYTGTPTTPITTGINYPYAMVFDAAEDLFVANVGNNTVTEYAPPYTGTPTTISSGISEPRELAIDGSGNLFVDNLDGADVTEYAPPYTGTPKTTIASTYPFAIALDGAGNLFVTGGDFNVLEYAPPYTGTPTTITTGVEYPEALLLTP
jgi:sugar lactone lactonase YvrE